jgi:hypothetical protein
MITAANPSAPVAALAYAVVVDRVRLRRSAEEQADEDAFLALYGAWAPMEPTTFAAEMVGFEYPWWVVGGWAIEAATGFRREHEDTDISILACDVSAFVEFMTGRWHVWNNVSGVFHPLGDRWLTSRGVPQPIVAAGRCALAVARRHAVDTRCRRNVEQQAAARTHRSRR